MTWAYFYDHYDSWQESTIAQKINDLTDFGAADEIIDVLNAISEERVAIKLLLKASEAGVRFNGDELIELANLTDMDTVKELVLASLNSGITLSPDQLEELYNCMSIDLFRQIALQMSQSETVFTPEQIADMSYDLGQELTNALIRNALKHNVSFTAQQIADLDGQADSSLLAEAASRSTASFTLDDICLLEGMIPSEALKTIARKHGVKDYMSGSERDGTGIRTIQRPGKLFTALAVFGMLTEKKPKPKPQFHVGDLVRIKYRDQYGHIIDVNGSMYTVRFSNGRRVESYTADELSKA